MRTVNSEIIDFVFDKEIIWSWNKLWNNSCCAHLFNSYKWFLFIKKVFPEDQYKLLISKNKGEILAIMPLVKKKIYGINFYTNPGGRFIDRSPLLVLEPSIKLLKSLSNTLKSYGSFFLPEMPEIFKESIEKIENIFLYPAGPNIFLLFENNPVRLLSKKQRKKIEKSLRLNESLFDFNLHRGDMKFLRVAVNIDKKSYKAAKNIGTFNNNQNLKFFKKLVETFKNDAGVNVLYYKGKPISYELGVRCKDVYYGLNKSFVESYKKIIPGKVTAYLLFKRLHKEGISMFDFCRGDDMLKRSFSQFSTEQYDVLYFDNLIDKYKYELLRKARFSIQSNSFLYRAYRYFALL